MIFFPIHAFFLVLGFYSTALAKHILIYDHDTTAHYPRNFRSTKYCLTAQKPDMTGLCQLNIMGSGAFNALQLQKVLSDIPESIHIIDLRKESHAYLNDQPISWYQFANWGNLDLEPDIIVAKESYLRQSLAQPPEGVKISKITKNEQGIPTPYYIHHTPVHRLHSEEEWLKNKNIQYERIYVNNHMHPEPQEVDRFLAVIKTILPDTWIYFHCRAGRGRTTLFMAMYDMWHNAKHVSFHDILHRQHLLGGTDLKVLPEAAHYQFEAIKNRYKFLKLFYTYAKYHRHQPWSEWLQQN